MNLEEYSTGDLNRYLRNGFAFLEDGSPILIYKVQGGYYDETNRITEVKYHKPRSSGDDWDIENLHTARIEDVDLDHPKVGLYNYKTGVIHLYRGSERQWTFAINTASYTVGACNVNNRRARLNAGINRPSTLKAIKQATYFTVDEAIEKIRAGHRGEVAISSDFWLGVHRYSEDIMIGYGMDSIVGYITPDNKATLFKSYIFLIEKLTQLTPVGGIDDEA